ncbi:L-serine ammonia-lyase, iron-sulfur-dependent subunit beta [Thermobrachium celere]|uniref:L-serine deaminase n=1 Tax=Thermobrachium celere DSM 8682 TaxID=941824 RepID=R7RQL5_9CLOT|nr:L-serine ammonia-lyase, iron-sulfur-dependent subunit beta [Thermobrachium celere]GFR35409.1 L-serine dehydratase, iron-sulfur-dependent subunit beta [Thermobrachium celere]CDF57568.1 L-serine dehydratase, beta subunit [Thermobrachium celere DSM 8682]
MSNLSAFDIIGPIMVGPSSSHTAGAARLGKVAMSIAGKNFNKVTFYLHGSFAKTYRGHGTDRALVAGILGMETYDDRLKYSLEIAKEKGIEIEFIEADLGDVHPNTVKIVFHREDGTKFEVVGSSIGGGNIIITEINGDKVEFTGDYPTLIVKQKDVKGMISSVTAILASQNINIATMRVTRRAKGKEALMIIETDAEISDYVLKVIEKVENILSAKAINPVK